MKNQISLQVLFVFFCCFRVFGGGNLIQDSGFTSPTVIMPDYVDQVMKFEFQNQGGTSEAIEKITFDVVSGNVQDLDLVDIFNGVVLEESGNAFTGNMFMGNLEFLLSTPIIVPPAGNVFFSVNVTVAPFPIGTDIQLEIPPHNFALAGANTTIGDVINTGLISFSGGGAGLTVTDNVSFSVPSFITPGSVNVDVLNYNIFNSSGNDQYIDALDIYVEQGSVNDIAEISFYQNGAFVVSGNATSGNFISGNVHFDFNPPVLLWMGSNTNYEVEVSIEASPTMSILDLSIAPDDHTVAGGNTIGGDDLHTGAINLSNPPTDLELQNEPGFTAPTSMNQGETDVVVLEFKLLGGANIELIDHLEFNVIGDVYDITQLEIYDISNNFDLVASANMTDADSDGLVDYLDPDSTNASVNISNGNIFFRESTIYESLPSSSNVLELKISIDGSAVSDNLEFSLDPSGVLTVGDNLVTGSFVTSGPIAIISGNGGSSGNLIGHWPIDEESGINLYDISTVMNNGLFTGGANWNSGIGGNLALSFDGIDDYVTIDANVEYDNLQEFSVLTWFNPTTISGNHTIFSRFPTSEADVSFDMNINSQGNVVITLSDNGLTANYWEFPTDADIMQGSWQHFAATWDGSNLSVYIDATPKGTAAYSDGLHNSSSNLFIGARRPNYAAGFENGFHGEMQDFRFYSKALPQSEIQTVMDEMNTMGGGNVLLITTTFTPPTNIETSSVNVALMEFELDTTTNGVSSSINEVEFEVISGDSMNDFTNFELYDESLLSVVASSANVFGGNVLFEGLSHGLSGGSNTVLSLRGTTTGSFVSDNIELELFPEQIHLSIDGVSGSPQNSGPIALGGMGSSNIIIYQSNGFTPPSFLMANDNVLVFRFRVNNADAVQKVNSILINLPQGNAMTDLLSATMYKNADTFLDSIVPISHDNLFFSGFNSNMVMGNTNYSVNILVSSMPESPGMEFAVDGSGVTLAGGNVVSGSETSGYIPFSGSGGGNLEFNPSIGFAPPGNIESSESAQVLEFLVQNDGSFSEELVNLNMILPQGNVISDFGLAPELINLYTGNVLVSGSASASDNVEFNGVNAMIPAFGNVMFGVNVHISSMPESSSVQLKIESDSLSFTGGNTINMYNFVDSGSISLGGNVMGGSGNFTSVAIGRNHALYVKEGELFAVGNNAFSALGNVASTMESMPIKIGIKTDWEQVGVSSGHSVAVDSQGNVYGWGSNSYERLELLSSPTGTPVQLNFSGTAHEIGVSESATFVLDDMNDFYAIGRNQLGQLGTGSVSASENVFTQLSALGEVSDYSIGIDHGLAIVSGNLWGWGSDGFGQLGTNSVNIFTATPVLINNANTWIDIEAGGFHSFGITSTGNVFAWGKNTKGQLCDPGLSVPVVDIPTELMSLPPGATISEISAGLEHTMMLFDDGNVYIGGSNEEGQGTSNSMNNLDQFFDFSGAQSIEAGPYSSAAIFGSNVQMIGQSFDGSTLTIPTVIAQ